MLKLNLVERGIHRVRSEEPNSKSRLPITLSILRQLQVLWSREAADYDVSMTWAACCTAFFSFFRIGEITEELVVVSEIQKLD